jgi:hypothetical protein
MDYGQIRMQRCHDLCALSDGRSDALNGFRADISNSEDATPVGFQRMAIAAGIFAGQHKPLGIECNTGAGEPVRIRFCADEQKQVANRPPRLLAVGAETPAHRFQDAIAALPI